MMTFSTASQPSNVVPSMHPPEFLRRADAAKYVETRHGVPCKPRTLAKLASVGGGPAIHYFGKLPLYKPKDLDAWVASRITGPVTSTADRDQKQSLTENEGEKP